MALTKRQARRREALVKRIGFALREVRLLDTLSDLDERIEDIGKDVRDLREWYATVRDA